MNSLYASGSDPIPEAVQDAESTLRLIATLPSPQGIEDRVIAGVRSAPRSRGVVSFLRLPDLTESWLRGVAAAAIAFLVVGGGWGVYSRVQPVGIAVTVPQAGRSNWFSSAGAVRVPQTLQAPVVTEPALVQPTATEPTNGHGKAELGAKRKTNAVSGTKLGKEPIQQPLVPAR